MIIVFLGPPGAGKGTQAMRLSSSQGVPHVSTGDILRAAVAGGTELGAIAQGYLDRGALVPDQVIADVVAARVAEDDCADGVLLDGFPRTAPQAQLLDNALAAMGRAVDAALLIDVAEDELVRRLTARGQGRSDDQPEVIQHRLEVYAEQTAPVCDLYAARGVLHVVDGLGSVDEITARVAQTVAAIAPPELCGEASDGGPAA